MYVIVKYIPNHKGIEMPVLIVDSHSEILEFDTQVEADKVKELFQTNTDSGYRYEVKKIG
jgi:GTP-binding protein EngB required for normal cell division